VRAGREGPGRVPCVAMRGGTTRGFFFMVEDVPGDPRVRDELLLTLVAGAGGHQADGIGGADLLLSKVVLVGPSTHGDCDLDVVYGAITPGSARIKYGSNCGNLAAAAGLFAFEEGLVDEQAPAVRIHNPDSHGVIEARLLDWSATGGPTGGGASLPAGPACGPATGISVELAFERPGGTLGRGLLPTGRPVDRIDIDGLCVEVSVVDAGAVYVFVPSAAVGLDRATGPLDTERRRALLRFADRVRRRVAVKIGAAPSEELAEAVSPNVPKVAFVSAPQGGADCLARIVSSQSLHRAYAVTGAIATLAAATVTESVVARVVGYTRPGRLALRIGHPSGVLDASIDFSRDGQPVIERALVTRTARRLMTGELYASVASSVDVVAATAPTAGTQGEERTIVG
jgi:methylitaconate Delta-isomerase